MMFSNRNNHKEKPETDIPGIVKQEFAYLSSEEIIGKIQDIGFKDAGSGVLGLDVRGALHSVVRSRLNQMLLNINALYIFTKKQVEEAEKKLLRFSEDVESLSSRVEEQYKNVRFMSPVIYIVSALFFILAEIEFSAQTVKILWKLEGESEFAQWLLIIGIAMAPIFLKLAYSRFIEVRFKDYSAKQDIYVRLFYFITISVFIYFILEIAWVRGEVFKIFKLMASEDVYEVFFRSNPNLNTITFVGIAFILLLASSVLLEVGLKEFNHWYLYRKDKQQLYRLERKLKLHELSKQALYEKLSGAEIGYNYWNEQKNFNEIVLLQTNVYVDAYYRGYFHGRQNHSSNHKSLSSGKNKRFQYRNLYQSAPELLDQININSIIMESNHE